MPTVELPAGRLHYRVAGPATATSTVVFLHGLLVSGELWTSVAERLAARGIRSYAPDLPLGSHPIALNPDADLTPRGIAVTVLDFLAALDLREVTLVGNDSGGALCQFVLDTDASRIARLVLTNCDGFEKFPPPPFNLLIKLGRSPGRIKALLPPMKSTRVRHSILGYGGLVSRPLDPKLTARWLQPAATDADVRSDAAKFMRGIRPNELSDVDSRLSAFGKPVLLLWGTDDRFFKLSLGRRLADAFGTARLVEITGARTFVPLDEPARVADEIATFAAVAPTQG